MNRKELIIKINTIKGSLWDNGGRSFDRFTFFQKSLPTEKSEHQTALCLSDNPSQPNGFNQLTTATAGFHLGTMIPCQELSNEVLKAIYDRYFTYKNISVSKGTMKNFDIVNAIFDFVDSNNHTELFHQFQKELLTIIKINPDFTWECEKVTDFLADCMVDHMDELSPEGYYFGSHQKDITNIGFWELTEEMQ